MWNWVGVQLQTGVAHSCLQDFRKVSKWHGKVFLRTHCGILFALQAKGPHPVDFPNGRCSQDLLLRMKWMHSTVALAGQVHRREREAGYHGNSFFPEFHRNSKRRRHVFLEPKQH